MPCDYCGSLESKAELARRGAPSGRREGAGRGGARLGVVPVPPRGAKSDSTSFLGPAPRESEFSGKVFGRILGVECQGAPGVKWLTQSPRAPLGYEGEKCAPVAAHPFANLRVS